MPLMCWRGMQAWRARLVLGAACAALCEPSGAEALAEALAWAACEDESIDSARRAGERRVDVLDQSSTPRAALRLSRRSNICI